MGTHPALTLREARDIAIAYREDVMAGMDPIATSPPPAPKVEEVVKEYLAKALAPKVKCLETPSRIFRLHVLPYWGDRMITDITRGDCHQLIDVGAAKNGREDEFRGQGCRPRNHEGGSRPVCVVR